MNRREAEYAALVAAICFALAALLVFAGVAWPAMLSGYSGGGGGGGTSITPNSCTLPNVATGIDATGTLTCTQPSNVTGNAATATLATAATALAADGSNCATDNYPKGVDASGNAQNCTSLPNAWYSLDVTSGPLVPDAIQDILSIYGTSPVTVTGDAATDVITVALSTVGVTKGGTGLTTVAQGDLLYGSASNTLTALAKNTTATRYLANTGTSNNPAWAQVNMSNGVTGTLPVGNGGTGISTVAQGAVLYASALDTVAGLAKSTTATRYLANTGASNAPAWDQINLSNGVTNTLPLANITDDATASKCLLSGGSGGDPAWTTCPSSSSSLMDVKYYTSGSNNWTKPSNAVTVHVWCIGGGGGGGSGRRGTTNASGGGGGGGSGAIAEGWFVAADLPSSPSTVTVTIGASAAGGAAAGASGAENGVTGTAGNASTFGSYLTAAGGGGGIQGLSGGGSAGAGGAASPWTGRSGGSNLSTSGGTGGTCTSASTTVFFASQFASGPGGSGGGGSSTTVYSGGDGLAACVSGTAGGSGGTTNYGTAGGNGTSASANTKFGGGGGGGGAGGNASTNGGAGGNGGAPGGGGGGGGGCVSGGAGCTSGKGGDGAAGGCVVETYG